MFSTSTLINDIRNGSIPRFEKVIVEGELAVPICLLGDPAYPFSAKFKDIFLEDD